MKKTFETSVVPAVTIDNGNAHAFLFGDGKIEPGHVHFMACNNGISPEIEGPDFTDFSPQDQYFAAQGIAARVEKPCAVVVVLDERRASHCADRAAAEINKQAEPPAQSLLRRGVRALQACLG